MPIAQVRSEPGALDDPQLKRLLEETEEVRIEVPGSEEGSEAHERHDF